MRAPEVAQPTRPDGKSGDLAAAVIHDAQRLVSLEVALAKQEIKDLVMANAVAAGVVAAGGVLLFLWGLVAIPPLVVPLFPLHLEAALGGGGLFFGFGARLAFFRETPLRLRP